jgi:hypothetical protein
VAQDENSLDCARALIRREFVLAVHRLCEEGQTAERAQETGKDLPHC